MRFSKMSRMENNWDAVVYAADLTEEYVDFNKGDEGDPATLGG